MTLARPLRGRFAARWRRGNSGRHLVLSAVPLTVFALLYIVPMAYLVKGTLHNFNPLTGTGSAVTGHNYSGFLTSTYYLGILVRTIGISLLVTGISVVLGYPVGFYLARRVRAGLRSVALLVIFLPLVTSAIVVSYGWLILLGANGLVTRAVEHVGFANVTLIYNVKGIVIGLLQVELPLMILAVTAAVQQIDFSLVRAAQSLGASKRTAFLRVVVPLSLSGVRTGGLLVFTLSMGAYATPALIGGANVKLVSFLIYEQGVTLLNLPFAGAIAVVLLACTAGVLGLASAYEQLRAWQQTRAARMPEAVVSW